MSSDEKRPSSSSESSGEPIKGTDLEYSGKTLGYVTDITQYDDASNLKTTRDGKIVLIPQPNESQDDPLNWSQTKKNVVLFVISFTALLPNFGSAEGIPALLPQQMCVITLLEDGCIRVFSDTTATGNGIWIQTLSSTIYQGISS